MRPCPECQQPIADEARFCPFCGGASAAAAPADPMIGATVSGKFKVERLVGQGGMGRVYRARHLTLDRLVVLKMLHKAYSEDPQIVQRFQREARAASRLNHPNSIAVLDFGAAEDGTLYMAMEYLAGRDLARVVAEDFPLPEPRIIRIGAQILSALAEAHAQGIIHRDLKPENVMVEPRRDEADFVKVLDFGIAKITAAAENEPKLTQAGLVCGTPEYMSPEQARGADLDARSDLYSVGVILYQLATGELPFQSDTPVGFLTKHLVEVPVPPRQKRPELSEPLDRLIRRAMEKEPGQRHADAVAMREALLACAATPPARPAAPARPAPQPTLMVDITEDVPEPAASPPPPARAVARPPAAPVPAPVAAPAPSGSRLPLVAGLVVVALVGAGAAVFLGKDQAPAPAPAASATPTATSTSTPSNPAAHPERSAEGAESRGTPTSTSTPSNTAAHPERSAEGAESRGTATPTEPAALPATHLTAPTSTSTPSNPAAHPERSAEGAESRGPAAPTAPAAPTSTTPSKPPRPDRARAKLLLARGDAARGQLDLDGAIRSYLAAEAADPSLAELQKKLALCYQQQGNEQAAAARYRRYLATDPPDAAKVKAILSTLQ